MFYIDHEIYNDYETYCDHMACNINDQMAVVSAVGGVGERHLFHEPAALGFYRRH